MYMRDEYKFDTNDDDEEQKVGFENAGIKTNVDQPFSPSNYPVEGFNKYIRILTVKNNKFWIVTNDNALYTMKYGGLPEINDTTKLEGGDITMVQADDKGNHWVVLIKTGKPKYKLFYLSVMGNIQKIVSFKHPEEITCLTVYAPTENNPDDKYFEVLFGTCFGSIYHGRFYMEKKGNFKVEMSVSEVVEISPKRKIYDIKTFQTEELRWVICITESSLHQYWGKKTSSLPELLILSSKNSKKTLDSTIDDINFSLSKKGSTEPGQRLSIPTLSLMENMDETIWSIGWQARSCFYYIEFSHVDDSVNQITREMISEFAYPTIVGARFGGITNYPVNSIVTEWHVIFMLESTIWIYSKITKETVLNTEIGGGSQMLGLWTDNYLQTIWMHTNKKLFKLEYSQESKNIWLAYLKMSKYKDALNLCKDPKYQSIISGLVAEQVFETGNYDRSVEFYVKSNKSFEEVALKFLSKNLHSHLCKYLEQFLERVKRVSQENPHKDYYPQKILLWTWIIELKLNEINRIKIKYGSEERETQGEQFFLEQLEKEFWVFLNENFEDKRDIDQILRNHGMMNLWIKTPKGISNYFII